MIGVSAGRRMAAANLRCRACVHFFPAALIVRALIDRGADKRTSCDRTSYNKTPHHVRYIFVATLLKAQVSPVDGVLPCGVLLNIRSTSGTLPSLSINFVVVPRLRFSPFDTRPGSCRSMPLAPEWHNADLSASRVDAVGVEIVTASSAASVAAPRTQCTYTSYLGRGRWNCSGRYRMATRY